MSFRYIFSISILHSLLIFLHVLNGLSHFSVSHSEVLISYHFFMHFMKLLTKADVPYLLRCSLLGSHVFEG